MGALGGHLGHIYENFSLTFKEVKDIFTKINEGKMLVTEKLDGTCLHLSYSVFDGKARAARNCKNISEGGVTLENVNLLTETIEILPSFTEALKIFEQTIKKLSIDEQVDIFGPNANYYYNCEIQDPSNPNVLLYDRPMINIHRSGHLKFNKFNKKVTQETLGKQFIKLEKLLLNSNLNENVNDGFIVRTNQIRKLEPLIDKNAYSNSLKSLQNEMKKYRVTDRASLAEYVLNRLDEIVENKIPGIPKRSKIKLLERLMRAEGVTAKDVYESLNKNNSPHLIEKVRELLNSERKCLKEAISPVEQIITDFGSSVLKEFKSSYIKEADKEIARLKTKLQEIFDIVGTSGNSEAQTFLNNQFNRIKDINNISSACEGIVFKYDGNIYKLTGMFSPLNQILGMMKFPRGNVPPLKTLITMNENKTVVLSWGRFNPPTIGHEVVFKFASDLAKENKSDFFIVPTKTTDKEKNPLTLQEKITYLNKIFPEYTNNLINSSQINTIIEAAKYFNNKGYKNLKLVVGSDRKEQFEHLLNKYNNKEYNFNSIEIVSAGERLDEGEGAASISASKMRQAATEGNIEAFMKCVAGRLEIEEGIKLMNLIRSRIEIVDGDKKKFLEPVSPSLLAEIIRKSGNKWCLFSKKKTKDGKRKKLGCYNSRAGAKKRERQVQYFKHIKEEQEIEEMSAMGAGAVAGHISSKNDVEEQSNVYLKSVTDLSSKYGRSFQKRDDEPSKKELIKILIIQEEQFMINRKEFIEEMKLRKIIREGLKLKIKERQEKILQEEKQLRLVIRKLLQEKEEEPPHPMTGINILRDLLKKIVPVLEGYYKDLTTSEEQRKSFRAHIVNATKNLLDIEDTPEENVKVDVELKEQEDETPEDPRFISIDKPKMKMPTQPQEEPDTFGIEGLDTTGRDVAAEAFKKIEKQIKNAYAVLSDQKDKEAFREYLLTNELLHMDKFEKGMKPVVKEPTTPSYEKEKNKLDTEEAPEPEATTTSQLPSSTPEQTPPVSPNPIPGTQEPLA
jgi:nicotinic acid mononucleotide adenylyltransferase